MVAITRAAAGVGSPVKCFFSAPLICTLNLASLSAAQATRKNAPSQPTLPKDDSVQV